ncbi:MAG: ABC transporter permease [Desulfurococcaceae archaeon]|nr:ABC transporter permease [Desulfurococcaceae archaeon]
MLKELILKEFKDLVRDPRIWIPFIISALVLPLTGLIVSGGMRESISGIAIPSNVLVSDLDNTQLTRYVINNLNTTGLVAKLEVVNISDMELLKDIAVSKGYEVIIIITPDFTNTVLNNLRPNLTIVDVVKSISFIPSLKSSIFSSVINDLVGDYILKTHGVNLTLDLVKQPVNTVSLTYISTINQTVVGGSGIFVQVSMASILMPIMFMIITITVLQMAATSTAIENEEKTLEVLLTLPISRFKILLGKLLGSFAVALLGSLASIVGFIIYILMFSTVFQSMIPSTEGFNITPIFNLINFKSVAFLIVSLILSSFAMAALGVTVGVLSSDVRIASTVSSPIVMLVVLPGYYVMFADVGRLGSTLKYLLYMIPFTQPMIMAKELMFSSPGELTILWLITSLIFSLVLILLTSQLLRFEKLVRVQRFVSRLRRRYT